MSYNLYIFIPRSSIGADFDKTDRAVGEIMPVKIPKLVPKYICQGFVVKEYTIAAANPDRHPINVPVESLRPATMFFLN